MATPKIQGAKYRVPQDTRFFKEGAEVTLVYDDGTIAPWFSGPIANCNGQRWFTPKGEAEEGAPGAVLCKPCSMNALELIEVPESHRIAELEKEVAALKAQLAAKEPLKVGDRVRVELPSMEGVIRTGPDGGTYEVIIDGFGDLEWAWLKPERLTRI